MTRAVLLLALLPLAGCLDFEEPDLFPVCEDRRAEGPSPTYTLDELRARVDFTAPATDEETRALLDAVRLRVLTLKAAPYRTFTANMSPADDPGTWRFRAHGAGGPENAPVPVEDIYDVRVALDAQGRAAALGPVDAPDTIERVALRALGRNPEMPQLLQTTPHHRDTRLDPALPACALLTYASGTGDATTLVVVNVVRGTVVHYDHDEAPASG